MERLLPYTGTNLISLIVLSLTNLRYMAEGTKQISPSGANADNSTGIYTKITTSGETSTARLLRTSGYGYIGYILRGGTVKFRKHSVGVDQQ
ncbi:MAG: hypothetical protein QM610_00770 [Chitinophagaceae bacterium]